MNLTYRGINYQPQAIAIATIPHRVTTGKYRGISSLITPSYSIPRQSLTTLRYRGVDYFPEINHRVDVTNSRTKFKPIIA